VLSVVAIICTIVLLCFCSGALFGRNSLGPNRGGAFFGRNSLGPNRGMIGLGVLVRQWGNCALFKTSILKLLVILKRIRHGLGHAGAVHVQSVALDLSSSVFNLFGKLFIGVFVTKGNCCDASNNETLVQHLSFVLLFEIY